MAVLPKLVGDRIKRREDPALIQGFGKYVDDIPLVGTLHAAFFRSPYAHASIKSLNVEAARKHPGVVTVLTGERSARQGGYHSVRCRWPGDENAR